MGNKARLLSLAATAAVILVLGGPGAGKALEIGEQGQTYPIREKSMTEIFRDKARSLSQEDKEELQNRIRKQAQNYRLPNAVTGLPPADQREGHKVDLTYRLPYAIKGVDGRVIYPKGYSFNPLKRLAEKGLTYQKTLIVINGQREAEVQWFLENFEPKLPRNKLLITDGIAPKLAKRLERPVYYLTKRIKDKMMIEKTPSVVFQKDGEIYMRVETFPVISREDRNNAQ